MNAKTDERSESGPSGNANAVWITGVARECPQVILVGQLFRVNPFSTTMSYRLSTIYQMFVRWFYLYFIVNQSTFEENYFPTHLFANESFTCLLRVLAQPRSGISAVDFDTDSDTVFDTECVA
jgi:hypothetical protein